MRLALCSVALTMLLAGVSLGQTCTSTALHSVGRAKLSYASGDAVGAKRLLEQAEVQCPDSSAVFREIAKVYELMEDPKRARLYKDQADKLGPKREFRQPGTTAPGSLGSTAPNAANPPAPVIEDNSFVREKWALVVGVGKFRDPTIQTLEYAAKDASDFAAMLRDPHVGRFRDDPEHVQLLTDDQATVGNIRAAINRIARNARTEDLVALYFSSHGSSAEMDVATERGQTGYIVAHDTDIGNLYGTAFPMDELKRVVDDRFIAGRVVTFLDTCFSGDTIRRSGGAKALSLGIPTESIARIAQGKGRVVITSSRYTEKSWESQVYKNSFFTHFLLEAMRAKDGLSTVTQLFTYLQDHVPKAVKTEKSAAQNPTMLPEGRNISIVIGTTLE